MTAVRSTIFDAVLQMNPPTDPGGTDVSVGLGGGALGTFLSTLVVGAILVALAPEFTRARMRDVVDDPVGSFVYGIAVLLVAIFLLVLLVITIIGVFVAFPLALVLWVTWVFGAVIGYLAIAERIVGLEDGWLVPLLVAAGLNGILAATGIGGLVSFCIGAAGFGTVLRAWL